MSAFLRRSANKGMAEVTGNKVNRGAGYGLRFHASTISLDLLRIERLKTVVEKQRSD